jgi:hypothetical protein
MTKQPTSTSKPKPKPSPNPSATQTLAQRIYPHLIVNEKGAAK